MAAELTSTVTEDGKIIMKEVPFTGIRKAIAANMEESFKKGAPSSSFIHVNMSNLVALKEKHKEQGYKFTYTDYFIKLVASTLDTNPWLNAALAGRKLQLYSNKNISIGIATPEGMLYAPVIRDAEKKGVAQISSELKAMVNKAMDGQLTLEEMAGATFTISNLGKFDVCAFTPVLSAPQLAVLGIGRMKDEAVVENGEIVIRPMSYICITVDHTIVMGSHVVEFYRTLIEHIENPEKYITL